MEKKRKETFSKIVLSANKLTRQRTLQINNSHLDRGRYWKNSQEATKNNFLIHGELTEENKALRFFSEGIVIDGI